MAVVSSSFDTNDNPGFADPGGSDCSYMGSGDSRELVSGQISKIKIDKNDHYGFLANGDIVIPRMRNIHIAAIKRGTIQVFWGEN